MDCPKCVGRLQATSITERKTSSLPQLAGVGASFELNVDKCFSCGGVWFDKGELDKYLSDQINVVDSPALGGGLDEKLDKKSGYCPRCKVVMEKVPAPKLPDMTVDRCTKCHGIWLDSTEVDQLEKAHKKKLGFLELIFKGFRKD